MDLFTNERASSIKVIKLLFKNIWLIIVFTCIGGAISFGLTFFQPKKYYSYAVIFPSNSNSGLNVLEDPRFGNNLDADQLMQLLESQQLKDTIIQMYNLEVYYETDKSERSWKQKLEQKFFRDINFSKTRYYSVVISAKMKDPDLCANVVNSIVEVVDILRLRILRQSQLSSFWYAEEQYLRQQQLIDSLKKVIYSKKEILSPKNILYNHMLENTKSDFYNTSPFVDNPEMESLVEDYYFEIKKLIDLKADYHKAKRLIKKPFSKVFLVNKAEPSYKKYSPSFLVNMLIGFGSSFFFIILFVIVRNGFSSFMKAMKE